VTGIVRGGLVLAAAIGLASGPVGHASAEDPGIDFCASAIGKAVCTPRLKHCLPQNEALALYLSGCLSGRDSGARVA
jgi:hypothetical protein